MQQFFVIVTVRLSDTESYEKLILCGIFLVKPNHLAAKSAYLILFNLYLVSFFQKLLDNEHVLLEIDRNVESKINTDVKVVFLFMVDDFSQSRA